MQAVLARWSHYFLSTAGPIDLSLPTFIPQEEKDAAAHRRLRRQPVLPIADRTSGRKHDTDLVVFWQHVLSAE